MVFVKSEWWLSSFVVLVVVLIYKYLEHFLMKKLN